jgi:hypothetical protein
VCLCSCVCVCACVCVFVGVFCIFIYVYVCVFISQSILSINASTFVRKGMGVFFLADGGRYEGQWVADKVPIILLYLSLLVSCRQGAYHFVKVEFVCIFCFLFTPCHVGASLAIS